MFPRSLRLSSLAAAVLACPNLAFAQDGESSFSAGDTAWMITATALVLFMMLPGLALFYGGLVRVKNFLSVLMHCFTVACLASVLWVAVLYSLSFAPGNDWIGGLGHIGLRGIGLDDLQGSYPATVWVMFQMTFAIITPGLIIGSFVERMKFKAVILFCTLWLIFVYAPVTHWVWGGGWMQKMGAIDLAGGIVVHATAGVSALILAKFVGPRRHFPHSLTPPHSPGMVMIGASMLWVGWFGFNAGSQGAASTAAGMTMLVTHISASVASLTWMSLEWFKTGKPGLIGIVTGMVAGLATITPASGVVGPLGAAAIGFVAAIVCYYAVGIVKQTLGIDDALDVFAVHGVGGITGSILLAVLGTSAFGGFGQFEVGAQLLIQIKAVGFTVVWSAIASVIIAWVCNATVGLRIVDSAENQGLDESEHGEVAYRLE